MTIPYTPFGLSGLCAGHDIIVAALSIELTGLRPPPPPPNRKEKENKRDKNN